MRTLKAKNKSSDEVIFHDSRQLPRYAGCCTFFRLPYVRKPCKTNWVLFGVPFDAGTTYRPGARFGPRSIRQESQYIKPYHMVYKENWLERQKLVDGGDCQVSGFSLEGNLRNVEAFGLAWRKCGAKTFAVGGDHSIALGNIRATARLLARPIALIHFDAHTDCVDVLAGEAFTHASPIRRAVEEGIVDPMRTLQIGIRGPVNGAEDFTFADDNGITIVSYDKWRSESDKVVERFRRTLKGVPLYLSFDIDCIDPAFAPGTGTPSIGGFTSAEVIDAVRRFRGVNLVGADMVEVCPAYDNPSQITSLLAAHIIYEIISL